jgi:hypothetical protein
MPVNFRQKVYLTGGAGIDENFLADGSLASNQFYFVIPSSATGYVQLGNGASNPTPIGVLQNAPASGGLARVRVFGSTCLAVVTPSGCGLAYGRFITASTVGQGVPTASETGGIVLGRWLDAGVAAASGTTGKAFVNCAGFATCAIAAS